MHGPMADHSWASAGRIGHPAELHALLFVDPSGKAAGRYQDQARELLLLLSIDNLHPSKHPFEFDSLLVSEVRL
jgi:hypothetical protein